MNVETVVVADESMSLRSGRITDPKSLFSDVNALAVLKPEELDKLNKITGTLHCYEYSYVQPIFHTVAATITRQRQEFVLAQGGLLPHGITSDELRPLKLCPAITYLDLSNANLTHLDFLPALKLIRTLKLNGAAEVSDLGPLRTLAHLEDLDLTGCVKVEDASLLNLIPSLKNVNLTKTGVLNKMALTNPKLVVIGLT
jgi:hypothetical protein